MTTTPSPFPPVGEYFNFTHDTIERHAVERPDALALWWINEQSTEERKLTFAQLAQQARRAAAFFQSLNLKPGDTVLLILQCIPEWWIAMLGLIRIGAVPIPGTPLLTAKDIAYRLDAANIKAVITDDATASKLPDSFAGPRILVGSDPSPNLPNWTRLEPALAIAPDHPTYTPTRAADPGIIYFTSGTTGNAKMVVHSHTSYALGHTVTGKYWLDLHPAQPGGGVTGEGDMLWTLADTGWAKTAWSNFYSPWIQGATIFVMDMRGKFDPALVLKTLERYPITVFCAPATALRLIVRKDLTAFRFQKLRHCVSAGEALNPPVAAAWEKVTGIPICEGYGQTETCLMIGYFRGLGQPPQFREGSMGRAAPGYDLAIVDEDGHELPPNKSGQIAIRVKPHRPLPLFLEYWKNPEETASRHVGDFYLTGDTAYRDADGYFFFVGRADDVINSASYRIGPTEVESALLEHSAVLESAAIGVSDELRGEIVQAYVVLRPGHQPSEHLKRELQSHCKRVTAPYKYPRQIVFLPELPKTVSGKIRRVELRARAAKEALSTRSRQRRRRKFLRTIARLRRLFGIRT